MWKNRTLYLRAAIILLIFGGFFAAVAIRQSRMDKVAIVQTSNKVSIDADDGSTAPSTATPTVSAPVAVVPTTSTPPAKTAAPSVPATDPAICNTISSQETSDLDALNTQIVQQLQVMKSLIGNSSLDSSILARGGSVSEVLAQSSINESFNTASANADTLIAQYTSDKQGYQDQLLANFCYHTLDTQLNG